MRATLGWLVSGREVPTEIWEALRATAATSLSASALLARLLIVGMILQFAKETALLHLLVEALERRVNRFVGLYVNVDQSFFDSRHLTLWHIRQE